MINVLNTCKTLFMGLAFFWSAAFAEQVIHSDKAIFTVEKRAFLKSDVVRYVSSLKRLNCIYSDSLLAMAAGLDTGMLKKLYQGTLSPVEVEGLIKVVKITKFADSQVSIDFDELWKGFGSQRCLKNGPKGWSSDLKQMFLSEVFLQERFKKKVREQGSAGIILFGKSVSKKYIHHAFN
ncbi:MAG: hypothetical protein KAG61_00790 [Bacteriovoracaceae bacterium]|nr:hypothetical protein [Bacteriovoracaceae bacterium]